MAVYNEVKFTPPSFSPCPLHPHTRTHLPTCTCLLIFP